MKMHSFYWLQSLKSQRRKSIIGTDTLMKYNTLLCKKYVQIQSYAILISVFTLLFPSAAFANDASPAPASGPPTVSAASAILVDAATGQVLYQKNSHLQRPVASTTKIMTALVTIEHCPPNTTATVSRRATEVRPSIVGLQPGEQISVEQLLEAMLIKSANDAALALAERVGGSEESFARMMNQRAVALGARNTHFSNPHGLYDPQHYSSAYDLALMARQAMKLPLFRELVSTRETSIARPDGTNMELVNHNRLLFKDPSIDGIKTGFVRQSGKCLVASASRKGWRLIAVVLDSGEVWKDAETLLNYGFRDWEATVFTNADKPFEKLHIRGGQNDLVAIPRDNLIELRRVGQPERSKLQVKQVSLWAPVRKGQAVGEATLIRDGHIVGKTLLVAHNDVKAALWLTICRVLLKTLLWIFCILAGLVGAIKIYVKITKAARRRRYRLQAQG
jgi:serine-type D-Ala-D-Ala carboxypeptidase (penicillin-binding protein 5/6)